ncbi:MAG: hypothetical protein QNJ26_14345 [Desulfobacterales bacterium]|nr:hypothetical protein [Desulfobacterales bacterium]
MIKFIFSVTFIWMVFGFNISFAQDVKIDEAFRSLAKNIWKYSEELNSIRNDLIPTVEVENSAKNYTQASIILELAGDINSVETIYKYEFFLLVTKPFINDDNIKPYCQHIFQTLQYSKMEINSLQKNLQNTYRLLENKAALNSAEIAQKIIKDSLSEIESTATFLESAIRSMP